MEGLRMVCAMRAVALTIGMLHGSSAMASQPVPQSTTPSEDFVKSFQPLKLTDIGNPADKGYAPDKTATTAGSDRHLRSFEMPPVNVVGVKQSELREEQRIGNYGQPLWTADRRFTGTRTYVIPESQVEFEYWLKPEVPQHGGPTTYESLFELEVGLPHRFQLDLYFAQDWEANGGKRSTGESIEIRYALADWGKIWGNPAFYLEYSFKENEPDRVEGKLLLTGELAPRWHWGFNFSFETAISGIRDREYELTGGISYSLIDQELSVGAEFEGSLLDDKFRRGNFHNELKIGPSIQWRPLPQIHIDLTPLFGVTDQSPTAKIYLIFGYEF